MSRSIRRISFGAAATALACGLAAPGFAVAAEPGVADQTGAILEALEEHAPAELVEVLPDNAAGVGIMDAPAGDGGAADLLDAPVDTESSTVVPVELTDESAMYAIYITDATAPTTYDFAFGADVAGAQVLEDGSVLLLDSGEDYAGGILAPWAKDANGADLETWFTVDSDSVTQHVELDAEVAFPVIADPWLGNALLKSAWMTDQGGSRYVIHAVPTDWGRQWNGTITHIAHVDELKSRLGSLANKVTPTIDNQFICHVMFNWGGGGLTYSMESWKPNIYWGNLIGSKCN